MSIAEKSKGSELLFNKKHQLFFNFLNHTNQAQNAINYLHKMITEMLPNINVTLPVQYLDIGCGYGDKTQSIIDQVKKNHPINTTAIDPSAELLSIFKKQSANEKIDFICSAWEDYNPLNKFHLITSVHTFYYISDWEAAISKMLEYLDKNGAICIVIRTNDQVCQFKNYFFKQLEDSHKKEPDFDNLCNTLNRLGLKYKSDLIESQLNINDCLTMNEDGKNLIEFLLRLSYSDLSNNISTEIKDYLESHQHNGCLQTQDAFVWITH